MYSLKIDRTHKDSKILIFSKDSKIAELIFGESPRWTALQVATLNEHEFIAEVVQSRMW